MLYNERRKCNEDRVAVILSIAKPGYKAACDWPQCSVFGLYDGHGGSRCADYLRDNLHDLVLFTFMARSSQAPTSLVTLIRQWFTDSVRLRKASLRLC